MNVRASPPAIANRTSNTESSGQRSCQIRIVNSSRESPPGWPVNEWQGPPIGCTGGPGMAIQEPTPHILSSNLRFRFHCALPPAISVMNQLLHAYRGSPVLRLPTRRPTAYIVSEFRIPHSRPQSLPTFIRRLFREPWRYALISLFLNHLEENPGLVHGSESVDCDSLDWPQCRDRSSHHRAGTANLLPCRDSIIPPSKS